MLNLMNRWQQLALTHPKEAAWLICIAERFIARALDSDTFCS